MKKNLIFLAVLCATLTAGAQSSKTRGIEPDPNLTYFSTDNSNRQVNGNFEAWDDLKDADGNVIGVTSRWWINIPYYNSGASRTDSLYTSPATDRFGAANSALKMKITHSVGWYNWHLCLKPVVGTGASDYWPLLIEKTTDVYYSFWAKGEKGGEVLWAGFSELYDPKNNGGDSNAWNTMPKFTLTTEWREYGFKVTPRMDVTTFHFQPRLKGVYYIDDLSINYDDGSYSPPTSIAENQADDKSLKIISNGNKEISIFSLNKGEISISDISGKKIRTIQMQNASEEVKMPNTGIYIVTLKSAEKSISQKVVID